MTTEVLFRCSSCKVELPRSEFGFDGSRSSLCKSRCKACDKEYQKDYRKKNAEAKKKRDAEYYQRNQDAIKERMKNYREENRELWNKLSSEYVRLHPEKHAQHRRERRARLAGVLNIPFTVEQLFQRMSMWGNKCWICGGRYDTEDHVKPISKGGPNILANLRPICTSCNSRKRATWPFDTRKREVSYTNDN